MIAGNFFVIIAARCLFFVHTREREREKKKEREERAKTTDENFVSTKYVKRGKKTSRCYCFSAATRERERDRLRNTLHNHAVFCQKPSFTYFAFLLIIIAY
jgi:uncharacterized protein YxeA